jgi:hypothetical protein
MSKVLVCFSHYSIELVDILWNEKDRREREREVYVKKETIG